MLFNSFHYLIFFIVVASLYFVLPHKYRWFLLLISSCYFYMVFVPIYICILGFTIVVDYFAGILIEQSSGRKRKAFLIASLCANIGVLAIFKYYNFFNDNFTVLLRDIGLTNRLPYLSILLPIGLSFHTFQAMSYTIEVYRGNYKAERHFGIYSLYVMFFPQLVAGPIERPGNLLPQFRTHHEFDYGRVRSGLLLIAWGIFKKVVIADRLAIAVESVYSNPHAYNSLSLIIASLFFTFEVYCDFSGYADVAIGSARILGFKLMKNFDYPFLSRSFSEFWRRWHISLSSWFRDYVYFPLGGNRVSAAKWYRNIMIVFLISGLWHGASWNYVIFGALQGFYIVFGKITYDTRGKLRNILHIGSSAGLSIITTFLLLTFSIIFFRATNLGSAFYIISKIFSGIPSLFVDVMSGRPVLQNLGLNNFEFILSFVLIIFMETVQYWQRNRDLMRILRESPVYVRWPVYYAGLAMILFFGVFENRLYIYFQF